jgi:hypothetical protein
MKIVKHEFAKCAIRMVAVAVIGTNLIVMVGCKAKTYGGSNPTGGTSGDSTNPASTSGDDAK